MRCLLLCNNELYSGVEPWTFEQHLGEAVFIPAGCPHQVRNRQVQVSLNEFDFLIISLAFSSARKSSLPFFLS